jgi:hypothetical protein
MALLSSYTRGEKCLFALTLVLGLICFLAIIILTLHFMIATQGMMIAKQLQDEQDLQMSFTRVAWLSKHACNGDDTKVVNIHCATAKRFSDEVHDPIQRAATQSHRYMTENSTLYAFMPFSINNSTWTFQMIIMRNLYEQIVGPVLIFILLFVMTLQLGFIPYFSAVKLTTTVEKRRAQTRYFDKPLSDILTPSNGIASFKYSAVEGEPGFQTIRTFAAQSSSYPMEGNNNFSAFSNVNTTQALNYEGSAQQITDSFNRAGERRTMFDTIDAISIKNT